MEEEKSLLKNRVKVRAEGHIGGSAQRGYLFSKVDWIGLGWVGLKRI